MALTPEELARLKTEDTAGYNQIASAGLAAKDQGADAQRLAAETKYNELYPTQAPVASPESQPTQTDLNKKMSDFTAGQETNQYGELVNAPSAEQVNNFNKQFTTGIELQPTPPEVPKQVEVTKVETTPNATTTTKEIPQAPVDPNIRLNEINQNLNEGYKNDPTVQQAINTGNFDLFKSKYNMQDPNEAKIVQDYFNAHAPNSPDSIFNLMRTGQNQFADNIKNTPAYNAAKSKYDIYSKYASMGADQLYNSYVNGEIGSDLEKEIMANPNLAIAKDRYQKKITTDNINSTNKNLYYAYTGKESQPIDKVESLSDKLVKLFSSMGKSETDMQDFKTYISQDPELSQQVKDLNAKNKLLKEKSEIRDNRLKEIIKEHPGISISRASVLAARQNEDLNGEIRSLTYEIGEISANVNYKTQLAEKDYSFKLQQQQRQDELNREQRGYAFDLLKTEDARKFETQQRLEQRTYDEQRAEKELQQKFDYTYGDISSTDPRIKRQAIQLAVDEVRKTYEGMPFVRTSQAMTNDIEKLMQANPGMTLSQALDENIVQAVQNSPDYANWKANNDKLAAPQTKYGFTEMGGNLYKTDDKGNISLAIKGEAKPSDLKWTKLDDGLYQDSKGGIHTKQELDQQTLLNNKLLNTKPGTDVGIECGQYARTATGMTATPGGNSLSARKEAFNSSSPTPGGLVLFSGGGYDKTYGHIAVVTGVNADGTINVKEANYRGDKKVTERKNIPTTYVSGYYNNTPLAGGSDSNGADNDTVQAILGGTLKVSELEAKDRNRVGTLVNKAIESKVAGEKDNNRAAIIKSAAYTGKLSDTTVQKINKIDTVKSQLGDIVDLMGKAESETGPIVGILSSNNPYNAKAQQIKALLQATVPNLARGVFGEVGVLTDSDIANYTKTLPNLKSTSEVNKLITDMLQKTLAKTYMDTIANAAKSKASVANYLQDYDEAKKAYTTSLGKTTNTPNKVKASNGKTYSLPTK